MLLLAWPMILTNLGQTAMTATDVLMMGRLGSRGARRRLARLQPLFRAADLRPRPDARRLADDRDRTRPQAAIRCATCAAPCARASGSPSWCRCRSGSCCGTPRRSCVAMGQEPALAAHGRHPMCARCNGRCCPSTATSCCAPSSRRWSGRAGRWSSSSSPSPSTCFANWCLMYGNLGFPALGLPGSGWATTLSSLLMFVGLAAVVTLDRRFRRYRLFGRFWRADWPRFRALLGLGLPIAGLLTFEVSIFNAATFLMGLIDAASHRRLRHRHPDRLDLLHGADGPRPGGDGAGRPRPWRAATPRRSAAPAGRPSCSASASWRSWRC